MAEFDTVLKGGMVVDGTRSPRYRADVAIKDGVVAEIGHIDACRARQVLVVVFSQSDKTRWHAPTRRVRAGFEVHPRHR